MYTENYGNLYELFPWIVYDDDPISVLIVEDDVMMQAQFMSLVRTLDYEVNIEKVTKAEDAKRLLEGENFEHYDLIIADNFLEGSETGLDLWRYCRQHHPEVRFILTSGEQLKGYIDRLTPVIEKPDFLPKPFSARQALQKIQNSLDDADQNKLVANIKGRDGIKVSVPNETALPVGKQKKWDSNIFLILLFSVYIAVVATHMGNIWGEDAQPITKWLPASESDASQDEKQFDYYGDTLWNPRALEPVKIPKVYHPPTPE
jgi:CheY-like chemotaxis protein